MANIPYPEQYDDSFMNIFKRIIDELNSMGYTYEEAMRKAQDILDEAKQTNDMNESVQQQINTLIAESGTSDAEVLQARIDAEGNEYTVLKDRLDESDAQLAHNEKRSLNLLAPTKKQNKAIFTFIADDARLSDYDQLLPVVRDKNIPLGIAVITSTVDNGSMSWEQIKEFSDLGCEILSHTHNHLPLKSSVSEEEIRNELETSKQILQSRGYKADGLVYPQNVQSARTRKIVREYYRYAFGKAGRSGAEGLNYPNVCNYGIGRTALGSFFDTTQPEYTNQDTSSLDYYKERVDKAIENNGWLTFVLHSGGVFDETQQQHLRDVIDYIRGLGYEIVSPSEGFERYGNIVEIGDYSEQKHYIIDREGEEDSYDIGVEITDQNAISVNTRATFIPNSQHRIIITPITSSFAQSEGFPDNTAGILRTYGVTSTYNYRYQEYEQISGERRVYRRNVLSNYDWGEWEDVTNLVVYTGYDTYKASDLITAFPRSKIIYTHVFNAHASANGFPEGLGGILKTYNLAASYNTRYQEYTIAYGVGGSEKTYRRYVKDNSTFAWSDWVLVQGKSLWFTKTVPSQVVPANSGVSIKIDGLTGKSTRDIVTLNPAFFVSSGLIWQPYTGGNENCGLRVVNVTNDDLTLSEGEWEIEVIKK